MSTPAPAGFAAALAAIPMGTSQGTVKKRRYVATKTEFNDGQSIKLVAEELGGKGYISLNFYTLEKGDRLAPCEMHAAKVIRFVMGYNADSA